MENAAPDSFSVQCTAGRRWDHQVTGSQDHGVTGSQGYGSSIEGKQEFLSDFMAHTPPTSKTKSTHPKVITSEATGGQGQKEGGRTETEGRHSISMFPQRRDSQAPPPKPSPATRSEVPHPLSLLRALWPSLAWGQKLCLALQPQHRPGPWCRTLQNE